MTDRDTLFKYRIVQAESTANDARIMLGNGGSPRSIVNRSYYAVFYSVLALFLKAGVSINTSKHAGVIGLFDKEFIMTGKIDKKYSLIFHDLFDDRQEFDYKEFSEVSEDSAHLSVDMAESFLAMVKTHLKV
jgi:uncharacterized protein (UPF0332 family)